MALECPCLVGGGQDDLGVTGGIAFLQPGQQRRAEVEVQVFVIVHHLDGAAHGIVYAGVGVGDIALAGYALVPVVIWVSRVLRGYLAGPWVLPGGLVKMGVHGQIFFAFSGFFHMSIILITPAGSC
jgi:hypothetical protein